MGVGCVTDKPEICYRIMSISPPLPPSNAETVPWLAITSDPFHFFHIPIFWRCNNDLPQPLHKTDCRTNAACSIHCDVTSLSHKLTAVWLSVYISCKRKVYEIMFCCNTVRKFYIYSKYSWQSTEWQTYCNSKLNVTTCNTNWKPQHTIVIHHCTVSWTELYATTHSLYTALYCQVNRTVCHNTVCIQHCTVSWTELYATTHSLYTALYCRLNRTVCHNTVCIQHCTVSWTELYATTHSLYTTLYCQLNQTVNVKLHSGSLTASVLK